MVTLFGSFATGDINEGSDMIKTLMKLNTFF